MTIDLDTFKAKKPWLDFTFWIAFGVSLAMLLPLLEDAWNSRKFPTGSQLGAAVTPLTGWLLMHGYVRNGGVQAAGLAAASIAPEIARHDTVFGSTPLAEAEGALPAADDPDTMPPDDTGGCCSGFGG